MSYLLQASSMAEGSLCFSQLSNTRLDGMCVYAQSSAVRKFRGL